MERAMVLISGNESRVARNRLTPDAVQAVDFPSSRLGRRGLDEEHVRAFCGQVERELVLLRNERTMLTDEVQRLRRRVLGQDGDEAGPGSPEDAHVHAARILSTAQQTADRCVTHAQQYSRRLSDDALRRRDEILAGARSQAVQMLEKAHGAASRAAEAALATPENPPVPEPRELEAELAYLRRFSDAYRAHLQAYLETLVSDEGEPEPVEPAPPAACSWPPYRLQPQPQPLTG
jgi:DivIVA domain-containing protein